MNELIERIADEAFARVERAAQMPAATYRLQFGSHLSFTDAAGHVSYLNALGASHVYSSPIFRARPDSEHGYDVCDHNELAPSLGGTEGFRKFSNALRAVGMGQILDFVPNHMAAAAENPWWNDVLENGPASPYSGYFDIDWQPIKDELVNRVLLPILGAQYGEVLESGQLQIAHRDGAFFVRYFDFELPLSPKTTAPLLAHRFEQLKAALGETSEACIEFQSILTALDHLPPQTATTPEAVVERHREKEVIKRRLRDLENASPEVARFVAENVQEFNGQAGQPASFDRLAGILDQQPYRVSHWRTAADEINYRRFFDINGLAALCMEKPDVFLHAHRLTADLLAEGDLQGLRIDHIDGLYAPEAYLWRLQWTYLARLAKIAFDGLPREAVEAVTIASDPPAASPAPQGGAETFATVAPLGWPRIGPTVVDRLCERLGLPLPGPADQSALFGPDVVLPERQLAERPHSVRQRTLPLFVVVEKILGPDEPLPASWPVAGTTGYDSLQMIGGVFVDPRGWRDVQRFYRRFTGRYTPFGEIVHDCKRLILRVSMSSELQMLAHRLNRISEQHRRSRDFTLNMLRYALREILSCFPVYRAYPGPDGVSERDRRFVRQAVAEAKRRNPATESTIFDFIREVLLLEHPAGLAEQAIRDREFFTGRFQQVTSPVMAKGVEDTAFYVYFPLVSANDVGGDPRGAVRSVTDFHRENQASRKRGLHGLLSSTTHDTKRSEDVRARINVLSEIPDEWSTAVRRWTRLNRKLRVQIDSDSAPSHNDEYLFYQTLAGVWPLAQQSDEQHVTLIERMQQYMQKAIREAKQVTSWVSPNQAYEDAVQQFVRGSLERRAGNLFLEDFVAFHERVIDAGLYAALAQLTLKLTSPGVPDIYQGQELWDFSLVDPDNRRPVDFAMRQRLLDELRAAGTDEKNWQAFARGLAADPRDARLKLLVTWKLLQLRRESVALFRQGEYVPLTLTGPHAEQAIAFRWKLSASEAAREQSVVVVVPRILARSLLTESGQDRRTPMTSELWTDTHVVLDDPSPQSYRHAITHRALTATSDGLPLAELFSDFPVAVLASM